MTTPDMSGRQALVTGGASGIGLATVQSLQQAGAEVTIVDLAGPAARKAAADTGASLVEADVTDPADWERIASTAGGATIVHLNAGVIGESVPIDAIDLDNYRRCVAVNIDGVALGMRAMVPVVESNGGGDIVITASMSGVMPFDLNPVYAMTKHAVIGLMRSSAPGLLQRGIKVNAVCPGIVDTPMSDGVDEMFGIRLIPVSDISAAVMDCIRGDGHGEAWMCLLDRPATPFRFAGPKVLPMTPPV